MYPCTHELEGQREKAKESQTLSTLSAEPNMGLDLTTLSRKHLAD